MKSTVLPFTLAAAGLAGLLLGACEKDAGALFDEFQANGLELAEHYCTCPEIQQFFESEAQCEASITYVGIERDCFIVLNDEIDGFYDYMECVVEHSDASVSCIEQASCDQDQANACMLTYAADITGCPDAAAVQAEIEQRVPTHPECQAP